MISKSFTVLLVLLVFSVRADDIAAAATPDPDDDVLAAQDNDYLPAARLARTRAAQEQKTPFPFGLYVPRQAGLRYLQPGSGSLTQTHLYGSTCFIPSCPFNANSCPHDHGYLY
jgi:hypothetical protein